MGTSSVLHLGGIIKCSWVNFNLVIWCYKNRWNAIIDSKALVLISGNFMLALLLRWGFCFGLYFCAKRSSGDAFLTFLSDWFQTHCIFQYALFPLFPLSTCEITISRMLMYKCGVGSMTWLSAPYCGPAFEKYWPNQESSGLTFLFSHTTTLDGQRVCFHSPSSHWASAGWIRLLIHLPYVHTL